MNVCVIVGQKTPLLGRLAREGINTTRKEVMGITCSCKEGPGEEEPRAKSPRPIILHPHMLTRLAKKYIVADYGITGCSHRYMGQSKLPSHVIFGMNQPIGWRKPHACPRGGRIKRVKLFLTSVYKHMFNTERKTMLQNLIFEYTYMLMS